jgi:low affinity Fe/Cu permease
MAGDEDSKMPSEVDEGVGAFDRFATAAGNLVSRAPFFALSVLLVILWLIEGAVRILAQGSFKAFLSNTYQLQINTITTVVTFLLVALLQNTQTRADQALQQKLNAIADGLADLMDHVVAQGGAEQLETDSRELKAAVGLEDNVGSSD